MESKDINPEPALRHPIPMKSDSAVPKTNRFEVDSEHQPNHSNQSVNIEPEIGADSGSAKDHSIKGELNFEEMALLSPTITPSLNLMEEANLPTISDSDRSKLPLPDSLPVVKCLARARIPTTNGPEIFLHLYENNVDNKEHLAIVFGEDIRSKSLYAKRPNETQQDRMTRGAYVGKLYPGRVDADTDDKLNLQLKFDENGVLIKDPKTCHMEPTLVRIHLECYTGETAWSARCDCGEQFDEAGKLMGQLGHGCIVYLRQEGRGIGLGEKLKAYNLQDLGADTVQANLMLRHPADGRSFSLATAILQDLGLLEVRLLTNNPDKIIAVEGKKRIIKVIERIPMIPLAWKSEGDGIKSKEIEGYLRTKIERMGHLLDEPLKI